MSKIQDKFRELKSKNEKALISYIMTGFPNENTTLSIVRGLVNGGTDIIELGFPFSDPIADGPVIQNASTISLNKGAKIEKFFKIVKKIRKETDIPLVLMTYLLQDDDGQIKETHSISAGLDYPGVGPEHAFLKDTGNVKYKSATDREVINAFLTLTKTEGIIPALESAHAVSHAIKIAKTKSKSDSIVVTLSGRGDKDIDIVKQYLRKNVKNSR